MPAAVHARCARLYQHANYSPQIRSRHTARIRPGWPWRRFTAERAPAPRLPRSHPLPAQALPHRGRTTAAIHTQKSAGSRLTAATPVSGPRSSFSSAAKAAVSVDDVLGPRDIVTCAAAAGTSERRPAVFTGEAGAPRV